VIDVEFDSVSNGGIFQVGHRTKNGGLGGNTEWVDGFTL